MPQRLGQRHYVPQPKRGVKKNIARISTEPKKKQFYLQLIELFFPVMKNQEITEL